MNSFGSGVPRCVIAVSRLTIAMSARERTGAIGASTPAGFAANRAASGPSKWTSPPNANVTAPFGVVVVVVGTTVEGGGATVVGTGACARGDELEHAPAAIASSATTARRDLRTERRLGGGSDGGPRPFTGHAFAMGGRDTRPGPRGVRDTVRAMHRLMSDPAPALDDLSARYGPTFVLRGGLMTMVVVSDPAHLRDLLATPTDSFVWGHRFNVLEFIVGPGSMIVSDGDDHRRRRSAAQPGFARRRLESWVPLIVSETDRLHRRDASRQAGAFDLYEPGRALVRRIVIKVLFGDALGERADELGAVLEPAMTYGIQPALRQLPHRIPYTRRARARATLREADKIIYEEIDRRRRAPQPSETRDVLDTLLANEGETLSTSEVRDQVITLIAAGYDTTASGWRGRCCAATTTPGVWSGLRDEADRVLGNTPAAELDTSALRSLEYADAVVRETLRVHPPGVFSPREAARDLSLDGFDISQGHDDHLVAVPRGAAMPTSGTSRSRSGPSVSSTRLSANRPRSTRAGCRTDGDRARVSASPWPRWSSRW